MHARKRRRRDLERWKRDHGFDDPIFKSAIKAGASRKDATSWAHYWKNRAEIRQAEQIEYDRLIKEVTQRSVKNET